MRVIIVGDVVGRPGRRALRKLLPILREEEAADFVVVNGENAAAGFGVTASCVREILDSGADCITTGNHIWAQKGAEELVDIEPRLLRPANYPPQCPGRGSGVFRAPNGVNIGVINLQGRVFMAELDCPFRGADAEIERLQAEGAQLILVDFHAEATSEKMALGLYLDGRVAALVGTHTHVMTADEQILPAGTAYLTDVGMTGPCINTVIGVRREEVLARFTTLMPQRFQVPKQAETEFCAAVIEYSLDTKRALHIKRVQRRLPAGVET